MEEMQTVPPEATRKANVALSHDEIEKLAYSLWKARGCGDGFDEQDWLEAERRLQETRLLEPLESADSHASRLSRVIPQSMTMAGSSMMSGTGPSAGGVASLAQTASAARRSAMMAGQRPGPRGAEPADQAVIRSMIAASSS